ncbi:hypothetical protein RJ639_006176 [Escallonia herrerae]|uniref:WAT1-related protein n=1 Tax=Escallonia herrerae TaxID=1293975 RepID=A0AA88W028_9ASTE|nr:hypothetical protein RJ639_006176 [Escallonia herrerae]
MGGLGDYKPAMVMFGLQFTYAGVALSTRAALLQGMSRRVFVVYRQAIATLVIAPTAYLTRLHCHPKTSHSHPHPQPLMHVMLKGIWISPRSLLSSDYIDLFWHRSKTSSCCMGWKSFWLIFVTSLIGVTINQNIYFEGLYLASSSIASAMTNLVPAVTFVIASFVGLETVNVQSLRSISKIIGTVFCVSGAVAMALVKGPKLLNTEILPTKSAFGSGGENWLLGCIFLFGSSCCWSLWLILQVPVSAIYPDHLSLSAWMCFMSMVQSAILTICLERDLEAWKVNSYLELACCFYSVSSLTNFFYSTFPMRLFSPEDISFGIVGSGISFFAQAWCISKKGPLFSAMFNPLNTVIVTIFATIFLHEEIYTGSAVGAFCVVVGLYVVLWGKAKDLEDRNTGTGPKMQNEQSKIVQIMTDESLVHTICKIDLEEPLLSKDSITVDEN